MTISLRDGPIVLTIAPDRGAEVRSLEVSGTELLYRPPWEPAPLPDGPLAADAWERSWHGGDCHVARLASMLFSTSSAIAFSELLCDNAMMVMAFQSSPISVCRAPRSGFPSVCFGTSVNARGVPSTQ